MIFLIVDVTAVIISAIGAVVSLGTVALTLIIKKNVDHYRKEVDGMKTELVKAVGDARLAEGKLEGKAEQKAEHKAEASQSVSPPVVDVKIVDQDKPVKVITEKPETNKK